MTEGAAQRGSQSDAAEIPPNPRGLKAAVAIMGVLLVVGFVIVFTTIIYRVVSPGDGGAPAVPRGLYGEVEVAVPAGAAIVSTTVDGDRALVHLREASGAESLVILDIRRGAELGRFRLAAPAR